MEIQPRMKSADDIEFESVCGNVEKLAVIMQELLVKAQMVEKVRGFLLLVQALSRYHTEFMRVTN